MPIKRCTINGKKGWKWGDSGHCYTGPGAKAKAARQAAAAYAAGYVEKSIENGIDILHEITKLENRKVN